MDFRLDSTQSVGGRIASNAGLLFGAKTIGAALGFITLLIAANALNQIEFGILLFLHAYMLLFAEMMTFQPWQSVIRFGSGDRESGDCEGFARLLKFCAVLDAGAVVLAYVFAVALFGVFMAVLDIYPEFWPGMDEVDPQRLFTLVVGYTTVVLFQQIGMSTGVLRLFDRFRGLAVAWLVMPLVRFVGVLIAMQQGWGLLGFVVVWYVAALSRYAVIIGLGLWELGRRGMLGPVWRTRVNLLSPRDGLWGFATKAYADSSLAAGFSHLPSVLVMVVFGPAFFAVYKLAEEIARLLSEGVKLLDQVIYPELARILAAGQGGQILRLVTRASAVALGVGVALAAVVYWFGPLFIDSTVGADYQFTVDLAVLLVIGAAIFAAVAPLYPVFYAAGRPERAIYARSAGLAAYVVAFFLFAGWLGEIGAAWAWIAGYSVAFVIVVWLARNTLEAYKGMPAE